MGASSPPFLRKTHSRPSQAAFCGPQSKAPQSNLREDQRRVFMGRKAEKKAGANDLVAFPFREAAGGRVRLAATMPLPRQ